MIGNLYGMKQNQNQKFFNRLEKSGNLSTKKKRKKWKI
jgi:hypothetical protein